MSDEQAQLARRAMLCKRWRWMPGMATSIGGRVIAVLPMGGMAICSPFGNFCFVDDVDDDETPNLADPATLGCLLALVREARGPGGAHLTARGWRYYSPGGALHGEGATEAHALVSALEAVA